MQALQSLSHCCPYCGERIDVSVDCSEAEQDYVEDCPVCCQPMEVQLRIDDAGNVTLNLRTSSE